VEAKNNGQGMVVKPRGKASGSGAIDGGGIIKYYWNWPCKRRRSY